MDKIQWILQIPITIGSWTETLVNMLFTEITFIPRTHIIRQILLYLGVVPSWTFRPIDLLSVAGVATLIGFAIYSIIKT